MVEYKKEFDRPEELTPFEDLDWKIMTDPKNLVLNNKEEAVVVRARMKRARLRAKIQRERDFEEDKSEPDTLRGKVVRGTLFGVIAVVALSALRYNYDSTSAERELSRLSDSVAYGVAYNTEREFGEKRGLISKLWYMGTIDKAEDKLSKTYSLETKRAGREWANNNPEVNLINSRYSVPGF